ncbi:MAG: DUF4397 domain-containing protein [Polyangia bacterium]
MKSYKQTLLSTTIAGSLCMLTGCGGEASDPTPPPTPPAAGMARVRVAHLSPDAPAVDVCLSVRGSGTWSGPVLGGLGVAAGLPYGSVTKYLDVKAATYDVRIVAPGSSDCKKSLGGLADITSLPAIPEGASVTLAAQGELAPTGPNAFGIKPYIDDTTVASGKAKLRFVHASPGTPAVDVGLLGGVLFSSVFGNVPFGSGKAAGTNTNGYLETAPLTGVEISARASGTDKDVLAIKSASLPAGAVATAFAIGKIGAAATPLRVLLCVDNAQPAGNLSSCSQVGAAPERARVRIAHLSPDAPAVDVCIRPAGASYPAAPLLKGLGAAAGLSYPQITTYVDLPAAAYDVRIVLAGAKDCATGAVPDTTNVTVPTDITATIAALGVLDRSGAAASNPPFGLKVLPDSTTVAAGKGKLRFVHASPGTPAVDVGLGKGAGFTKLYSNVAFGMTGSGADFDAAGYLEGAPFSGATVSARLAGQSADALSVSPVSLSAGAIATAFAIGGKSGAATNPLKVLLCGDNAAPAGLLTACVQAP